MAAAAESPPPITLRTSGISVIALQTSSVPFAKASNSNTPIGPFQTTVFAPSNSFLNNSIDLGPISKPIMPSGIASTSTISNGESGANSLATSVSTGRINLSPAFSIIFLAKSRRSISTRDVPIS